MFTGIKMITLASTYYFEVKRVPGHGEVHELSKSALTYCEQLHEDEFRLSRGCHVNLVLRSRKNMRILWGEDTKHYQSVSHNTKTVDINVNQLPVGKSRRLVISI